MQMLIFVSNIDLQQFSYMSVTLHFMCLFQNSCSQTTLVVLHARDSGGQQRFPLPIGVLRRTTGTSQLQSSPQRSHADARQCRLQHRQCRLQHGQRRRGSRGISSSTMGLRYNANIQTVRGKQRR